MAGSPSENDRLERLGLWWVGPGRDGGHFYAKVIDGRTAITLCTDSGDGQSWTAEDLDAIASHKRMIDRLEAIASHKQIDRTENPGVGGSIPPLPI